MATGGIGATGYDWADAECPCGRCEGLPKDLSEIEETARWLAQVQQALGGVPLVILAWYLCPEAHAALPWTCSCPEHRSGRAVDFVVPNLAPRHVQVQLRRLCWPEQIQGLGSLAGLTHVHRGGEPQRWRDERG